MLFLKKKILQNFSLQNCKRKSKLTCFFAMCIGIRSVVLKLVEMKILYFLGMSTLDGYH